MSDKTQEVSKKVVSIEKEFFRHFSIFWLRRWTYVLAVLFGAVLSLVLLNYLFVPNLHIVRLSLLALMVLFSVSFIAILSLLGYGWWASRTSSPYMWNWFGRFVDAELLNYSALNSSVSEINSWSKEILLAHLREVRRNEWNGVFKVSSSRFFKILLATGFIFLVTFSFTLWSNASKELLSGQLNHRPWLPGYSEDTVHVKFSERVTVDDATTFTAIKDTLITWYYNNRVSKRTFYNVDSVPSVRSWQAEVIPPIYTGREPFLVYDSLTIYEGSSIRLSLEGILTPLYDLVVSRETRDINSFFKVTNNDQIVLVYKNDSIFIPFKTIADQPPIVEIRSNTRDTLFLECSDDYFLTHFRIDGVSKKIERRPSINLSIAWLGSDSTTVVLYDALNSTQRTIYRPSLSSEDYLDSAAVNSSLFNELSTTQKEELGELNKRQRERLKKQLEKSKNKNKELLELSRDTTILPNPDSVKNVEQHEFLEKLDALWKMEQLNSLLDKVQDDSDEGLDSALFDLSDDLLQNDSDEQLEKILKEVKSIPESGSEREQKAKEAQKALQELMNQESVDIRAENVERLKRILKQGWSVSVLLENTEFVQSDVNKSMVLRESIHSVESLLDTLNEVLVTDQKLRSFLSKEQENISDHLTELSESFLIGTSVLSNASYLRSSLNTLDALLYQILESEKQAMQAAAKKCKNGKPGSSGKPSSGKGGKKSDQRSGQKPGGRTPGKRGIKGDSSGMVPGSSGAKKLLQKIDELEAKGDALGAGKGLSDELENLKKQILFQSDVSLEELKEFEDKLWEVEKSIFTKEEKGTNRKAKQGIEQQVKSTNVKIKYERSGHTNLPLPTLINK